jgi:hypothetical protein
MKNRRKEGGKERWKEERVKEGQGREERMNY